MDFIVPYDQVGVTPPGPWQNASPQAGTKGSIVNAAVFPAIQTEILNVQDEVGITRDGTNFAQLLQAIRSGKLTFFVDTGTADALVISPRTSFPSLSAGVTLTILKGQNPNATTTPKLSVGGLVQTIVKEDGSALAAGDLSGNSLFKVTSDGTNFRVAGLRKSDAPQTAVYGATSKGGLALDSNDNFGISIIANLTADNRSAPVGGDLIPLGRAADGLMVSVSAAAMARYVLSGAGSLIHEGDDTSTAANTITVANLTPTIAAYGEGNRYQIKLANSITGPGAVANILGLGNRTIIRADGSQTQANDGIAGQMLDLIDDGANLQISGLRTSFLPSTSAVTFTSSTTWTPPAGVTTVKRVQVWGAGGGGGGSYGAGSGGSGGGGGGYALSLNVKVTPGVPVTVTVGAPGAGGGGNPNNGNAGGTVSFGSFASATGGGAGSAGYNGVQTQSAGAGGVGSGNALSLSGSSGGTAFLISSGVGGSGIGGSSPFGGGSPSLNLGGGGNGGNGPGGGANGGSQGSAGGTGGAGLILIEY